MGRVRRVRNMYKRRDLVEERDGICVYDREWPNDESRSDSGEDGTVWSRQTVEQLDQGMDELHCSLWRYNTDI